MSYSRQGSVREQMRFLRRQFLQVGGLPFTDILPEKRCLAGTESDRQIPRQNLFAAGHAAGSSGAGVK
jgi:hypothetical protein